MMDMWQASNHRELRRSRSLPGTDAPTSLLEAHPPHWLRAGSGSARCAAGAVGSSASARHARFLEVAMRYVSLLEPAQRVPTITELVNRSSRIVD
ncbi:hypothetical protein BZL30_9014, partial [Mycobacterium kansasii]